MEIVAAAVDEAVVATNLANDLAARKIRRAHLVVAAKATKREVAGVAVEVVEAAIKIEVVGQVMLEASTCKLLA